MADQNQQNQGQQKAGQQQGGQQGQTLEQQRAQAQQQGGRLQPDQQGGQQRSGQQQGGQQQGGQQDSFQRGVQQGQEVARQRFEEEKRMTAERPQQVGNEGSQPTPTQQENDEIRAGLRHIDDKEDDRSGADLKLVRRFEAEESRGKYETR